MIEPSEATAGDSGATRRRRVFTRWRLIGGTVVSVVLVVVWGLFLRGTLLATVVTSGSMEPTIGVGDRLIVWYLPPKTIEEGMVVVVRSPDGGNDLVKRVVGLPGDVVGFRRGYYYVNGTPRPAPNGVNGPHFFRPNFVLRLLPGQYFVLGDNRAVSFDSEEFGPVPREAIVGTVLFRYLPLARFGPIDSREEPGG